MSTMTRTGSVSSIYDAIGGADAVRAAVGLLYQRILADRRLAPYFQGVDMRRLETHMRGFFALALGGPDLYAGRDLSAAHAHLGISEAHFDAVAAHLVTTLTDLGVPDELNQVITARVDSLRPQIVAAATAGAGRGRGIARAPAAFRNGDPELEVRNVSTPARMPTSRPC